MDKELVILVPSDASAYQVMKALRDLDDSGAIELYSATVVAKTEGGSITIKDKHHLREPWGTVLGLSGGALIGLLGGPVGAAIGAAVGGAAGLGGDLAYSGFAGEFVRDIGARLEPGGVAVCASVYEDWTLPVDVEVGKFGAVVFRQATDDVVTAQIRADWHDLKEQEAQLEAEIKRSNGETKAKLEAKRTEVRGKIAAQRDRLKKRMQTLEEGWNAKIASIEAKTRTAKDHAKERHEAHVQKLQRFAAMQKEAFKELSA